MKPLAALLSLSLFVVVSCSSGTGTPDGAAGTSGSAGAGASGSGGGGGGGGSGGTTGTAGSGGTGGNAACASAVATQPCTAEGTICGGESCTSVCQFCNLVRCTNGVWHPMEVAPAPCFACGPSGLRCQSYREYCLMTIGGVPGSTPSYGCPGLPAACQTSPSCTCLQTSGVPGSASCAETGTGQLTVTLAAP